MADSTLNRFVARGTAAERALFTPDPPTPASGPDPLHIWYETDTGDLYGWDGSAWDLINAAGTGDLVSTNNLSDVANAGTARTNLGVGTGDSPQFTAVNVGHASDTTITRASAGVIAVEGVNVMTTAGGTFSADISVPDEAYDATAWNGSLEVPTKNAVRDKIESLSGSASALFEDQKAANTAGGGSVSGSWIARTLNTEVYDDIGLSLLASTVTITIATPGVITWNSHGLIANSTVIFTTTGALPTGLTAGTPYFVISTGLGANSFQVSATPGGSAINTSGSQSGTHTATASVISLAAGTYSVEASSMLYRTQRRRIRLYDITNSVTLASSLSEYGTDTTSGDAGDQRIVGRFTLAGTALVELQYRVGTTQAANGLGVESNYGISEIYSRLKLTKLS